MISGCDVVCVVAVCEAAPVYRSVYDVGVGSCVYGVCVVGETECCVVVCQISLRYVDGYPCSIDCGCVGLAVR